MKIFTYLSKAARRLFPQADDDLLERLEDDGLLVEPRHYVPVLPLLLVNGAEVRTYACVQEPYGERSTVFARDNQLSNVLFNVLRVLFVFCCSKQTTRASGRAGARAFRRTIRCSSFASSRNAS